MAVELAYKVKFRLRPRTPVFALLSRDRRAAADRASGGPTAPPRESLAGLLRERGTRTPLIGFVVTVSRKGASPPEARYEATSDGDGRFAFFDLAPGAWNVDVEAPAYLPFRTSEEIRAGEKTVVTYYVERGQLSPLDVTVTAARAKKDVSHVVLSAEVIDKVPARPAIRWRWSRTWPAWLARRRAAACSSCAARRPRTRRSSSTGWTCRWSTTSAACAACCPNGSSTASSSCPATIRPSTGAPPAASSTCTSRSCKPKRFGGYVDISLLDTGVYLEAPLGDRGGVAIAARRSYLDAVLSAAVPSDAPVSAGDRARLLRRRSCWPTTA